MIREYSINQNAQFFTVLRRTSGKKAFIFVWDLQHFLRFDSEGKCQDILYIGTGKTYTQALQIIADHFPAGTPTVVKYCPRSCGW